MPAKRLTTSQKVLKDIRPDDDENLFDSFLRGGVPKKPPAKPAATKKPATANAAKQQQSTVGKSAAAQKIPQIVEHPPEEGTNFDGTTNKSPANNEPPAVSKNEIATNTEHPPVEPQPQPPVEEEKPQKPRYRDQQSKDAADMEAALNSGNFLAWVTNGKQDDFGHSSRHLFGINAPNKG